jgi:hypothetical protein
MAQFGRQPYGWDPGYIGGLGDIGGVSPEQANAAAVDENLKFFDFNRARDLQEAKRTRRPVYGGERDPTTGEEIPIGEEAIPRKKLLTADEANRKYGMPADGLTFNEPITEDAAAIMAVRKRQEKLNQQILAEAYGWTAAKAFGMGIAASLAQPEQIPLNALPWTRIFGIEMAGTRAMVESQKWGTRMLGRARLGATEGLIGSAVAEPIQWGVALNEQADYSLYDTLANLAGGAVFGGGLHVVGGSTADWAKSITQKTWRDSLQASIAQVVDGRNVQVEPIVQSDPNANISTLPVNDFNNPPKSVVTPTPPPVTEYSPLGQQIAAEIAATPPKVEPEAIGAFSQLMEKSPAIVKFTDDGVEIKGKQFALDTKEITFNGKKFVAAPEYDPVQGTDPQAQLDWYGQFSLVKGIPKVHNFTVRVAIDLGNGKMMEPLGAVAEVDIFPLDSYNTAKDDADVMAEVSKAVHEKYGLQIQVYKPAPLASEKWVKARYIAGEAKPGDMIVPRDEFYDSLYPEDKKNPSTLPYVGKHNQFLKIPKEFSDALAGGLLNADETAPVMAENGVQSITDFVLLDPQSLGSNQGGLYRNNLDGKTYYVKTYKNEAQAKNEYLANQLYQGLGFSHLVPKLILIGGKGEPLRIGSEWAPDATPITMADVYETYTFTDLTPVEMDKLKEMASSWVVDAYLGNWDAYVYGNLLQDTDGNYFKIDQGGALLYRAQGELKGEAFGNTVPELETMRDPQINEGSALAATISDPEKEKFFLAEIAGLSNKEITNAVEQARLPANQAEELTAKLIARREYIKEKYIRDLKPILAEKKDYVLHTKNKHVYEWIKKQALALHAKLTEGERNAFAKNQGGNGGINSVLIKGNKLGDYDKELIKNLDSAIAKYSLPTTTRMYRWINSSSIGIDFNSHQDFVGTVWNDKAYQNFSPFKNNAFADRDVVLVVDFPPGTHIAPTDAAYSKGASSFTEEEAEFVLHRGAYYTIDAVKIIGGDYGYKHKFELHLTYNPEKVKGLPPQEVANKMMAWQKEASNAASGVTSISQAELDQIMAEVPIVRPQPVTLTQQILSKEEAALNEMITALETEVRAKMLTPEEIEMLNNYLQDANDTIKEVSSFTKAMQTAFNCYTMA